MDYKVRGLSVDALAYDTSTKAERKHLIAAAGIARIKEVMLATETDVVMWDDEPLTRLARAVWLEVCPDEAARPLIDTHCHRADGCIRASDDDTCAEMGQCSIVLDVMAALAGKD